MMHRQANFFASFFPEGTQYGDGRRRGVDVLLPVGRHRDASPVLVAGTIPAAFRDAPEVWAVMQYLGSPEYADARQTAQTALAGGGGVSGFLSANLNADQSLYTDLEQQFLEVLRHRLARPASTPPTRCRPRSDRHVLVRVDVAGQRRRGRPDGGRQHRGLLADELTAAGRR